MTTPWRDKPWLIIDTETTGIDETAEVCEIGYVKMLHGKVEGYQSYLVKPSRPIPAEATAIHGITNEMVANSPKLDEVMAEFIPTVLRHDVIAGYNGLGYDHLLLLRAYPGWDAVTRHAIQLDPLVVVRLASVGKYWKGTGRHKLVPVAQRFGLDFPEPGMDTGNVAHRAVWDCVMAGRILYHLRGNLPADAKEAHDFTARNYASQRADLDAYWAARKAQEEADKARLAAGVPDDNPNNEEGWSGLGSPPFWPGHERRS